MSETVTTTPVKPASIPDMFAQCSRERRAAVMPFLTAGYPDISSTDQLLDAIVGGGADLIELGVPFSDPLADGATVQHTSQVALANGTTLDDAFEIVARFRSRGFETPIVMMGYTNPFLQYGPAALAERAVDAGVNGFIIPDLPVEESDEFLVPFGKHGLDLVFMVAPTSTDDRLKLATAKASGFIYCVSLVGVTGARETVNESLAEYLDRVRSFTDLPLVVGFGISNPEHVREIAPVADGVIVASALINYLDSLPEDQRAQGAKSFVQELTDAAGKPVST